MASVVPGTRAEQKLRTRRRLLDSALHLLEEQGIDGLALREVTREAGVSPTAFYRHFPDIETLGVSLVEESFATLRSMIRTVRLDIGSYSGVIHGYVSILVDEVRANRAHFRFIARERFSGMAGVRRAIRAEITLFENELATDLARLRELAHLTPEDLRLFATVLVGLMVTTVEELLDLPPGRADLEADVAWAAEQRIRLVFIGVTSWRAGAAATVRAASADDARPA